MTWIKIIPPAEDQDVAKAMDEGLAGYPGEYGRSNEESRRRLPELVRNERIVASHSLIPGALRHAFATLSALFDPSLPLTRRQHEMIAAAVSSINRCFY